MADTPKTTPDAPGKKAPAKPAKGAVTTADGPTKAASRKTAAVAKAPDPEPAAPAQFGEAKSRFNAALEEAKAGAAALRAEAEGRLTMVGSEARGTGEDLLADAKAYGEQALGKAGELAAEGKKVTSDAIATLGKAVGDTAPQIDEKLGSEYGDYARKASRALQETSARLEAKTVEELSEDAREMVRKSPAVAVGVAAVFGFFLARLFSGGRR